MISRRELWLEQLGRRFPAEYRREPTEADFRALRELLIAGGGDIEELARWAAAVRDTDSDAEARGVYSVRWEWDHLIAPLDRLKVKVARIEEQRARALRNLRSSDKRRRRGRPRGDPHLDDDCLILCEAEVRAKTDVSLRRRVSATRLIAEVVAELWAKLAEGAEGNGLTLQRKLGTSPELVTARIFARIRPTRIGNVWLKPEIDMPSLAALVSPRKLRGIKKIGRPRR